MRYRVVNLGQSADGKVTLTAALEADWLSKIHQYMDVVGQIQAWVQANPAQAVSVGLDKDAANLPPSSDISSYPKLAQVVDDLQNHRPLDTSELQCVQNLGAAVGAAQDKIAAFQGSLLTTPMGIGIGAGILALVVGVVVLS